MEQSDDKLLEKLIQKAGNICAREEYCDYDIRQKLLKWGASDVQVERVLDYLHEYGYINNERYARLYCVGKNRQLKWGRIKIAYQLRMKCVAENVIECGLAAIDDEEYRDGLMKLAQGKWKLIKEENRYKKEWKVMAFLQGHGYEMSEIKSVIKQIE